MTPADIGQALVRRIEASNTRSPAVLREAVYAELAEAGVDVPALVADARQLIMAEKRSGLDRMLARVRLVADRVRSGRLAPEKAAQAREQLGRLPNQIKAQRQALKRLEARPLPQPPSAPTRELVRHHGHEPRIRDREPDGTVLSAPRYEFEWAVDRAGVPLTAEEYQAAVRLKEAHLRRENTPGAVDWNRSGASVPGSRLPIRDEQLAASKDFNAVWFRLPPALRLIVGNFVLEEAPRGRDTCLDAVEFGRLYGQTKDANRARGVTAGALRAALAVVSGLHRDYDAYRAQKAREGKR